MLKKMGQKLFFHVRMMSLNMVWIYIGSAKITIERERS